MKERGLTTLLSGATLLGLSCALAPLTPVDAPAHPALPAVSAAAPAPAIAPDGAAAPDRGADEQIATENLVTRVLERLARRRTNLAAFELEDLARTIVTESRHHRLDPELVMAVMHVESRFDNFAVSPVGAMGLMQIMPGTGEEMAGRIGIVWRGPHTLFDPIANVRLGTAYLRLLTNRYDDIGTALAAYNWGPGRIDERIASGTTLPQVYSNLVLEAHAAGLGRRS